MGIEQCLEELLLGLFHHKTSTQSPHHQRHVKDETEVVKDGAGRKGTKTTPSTTAYYSISPSPWPLRCMARVSWSHI